MGYLLILFEILFKLAEDCYKPGKIDSFLIIIILNTKW